MSDHSGQQIAILTIIWRWKRLGKACQRVNNTQSSYGEVQSQEIKQGRGKERYRVEISNKFAALENLDTEMNVNKDWAKFV
jgi:hypothetical protein